MKGLQGEMFGSFRSSYTAPDLSLVASPRHLPAESSTVKTDFQFNLPDNQRKSIVDSIQNDKFLSNDFLEYYVVREDQHSLEEVAKIGSKICANLSVAQHVMLYISKKELDQLATEMKSKNLKIIPDALKKSNGVLAETLLKSNKMYEYAIFIRANNPIALQNNGYEVILGEEPKKIEFTVNRIDNDEAPVFSIDRIMKVV